MLTADLLCEEDFYLDGFYLGCFEFFVTFAFADNGVVIRYIKIQGEQTPSVLDRQMALLAGQTPGERKTALFDIPPDWHRTLRQQLLDDDSFCMRPNSS